MDAEAKKHLDIRLAKGEIREEEYVRLQQLLTQSADAGSQGTSLAKRAKATFAAVKESFSGSTEVAIPTDQTPLCVTEYLTLFSAHFSFKGKRVDYGDIEGIGYSASSSSVNLFPSGFSCYLTICGADGRHLIAGKHDLFVKGKRSKLIQNAYIFLRQITFNRRLDLYTQKLVNDGFIEFGDLGKARLFSNGDIQQEQKQGALRLNLRDAFKRKSIVFGTLRSGYGSSKFNPDEVIIGDPDLKRGSRRIFATLGVNKDVIQTLLSWFCNGIAELSG